MDDAMEDFPENEVGMEHEGEYDEDEAMDIDDIPVTQEDAWAVIR